MPLEYPRQTYYPGCKARLILRFDEYGKKLDIPELKRSSTLNGVSSSRGKLQVVQDPNAPEGATRFLLLPPGNVTTTTGAGQQQTKSADDLTHVIEGVIPKAADWKQNGIRTADTLSMTIKWVDMPIDPRVIRACAVEFYVGTVTDFEFAMGVRGQRHNIQTGSNAPFNLIEDTYFRDGKTRTNLRFQGWVDKWEMDWSDGDEPVIKMECRDNTQLLLGQQAPPREVISGIKPIDEAIAGYMANFPQFAGLTVEYRPTDERSDTVPPRLNKILANTAFRPQLGPPPAQGGGAGGEGFSVWDYFTDVCGSIGHNVRIEGTLIIIQRVHSLVDKRSQPRADDPFAGRKVSGKDFPSRAFIYGYNILDLKVAREFSRKQPTNVELRCYSPDRKNVLVARFPENKEDRVANPLPGDGHTDQKWTVYRVSGVSDQAELKRTARDIYNNIHRQELQIQIKTRNLASFGGDNEDPDILDMKPGDNFQLLIDREQTLNTMTEIERHLSSRDLLQKIMKERGFSAELSAAYALAYTNAGFQDVYRLKEMSMSWSIDDGITLDVTGMNYIEARDPGALADDPNAPTGPAEATSQIAPTPSK